MPKITEAQRETRRQQILDAALRCFSRDGFHNTTTADIVRESGVSQGTLYLYFATKDEIIVALADDRHQGEAFLSAMAQSEQDPIEGLALLLELHGGSLDDPRRADLRRVGIQGWAEALRNPTVLASVTEGSSLVRKEIVRLIARGQRTGQIRPEIEPEAVARMLIALFRGLTLEVSLGEDVGLADVGPLIEDMIRGTLFTEAARAAHPKIPLASKE
ncbi:MAG: TetR/AcrR family transcriptional regulator [Rhizomicrobium sp.]|jgi:AcrR family transcriptional regulator